MARILVIDDEKSIRDLYQQALEKAGYEVVAAENGQVGIDLHRDQRADLIITDIMMPQKDGFETIKELQEHFSGVKIIAITGVGLHNLPVAFDLGAVRVFEKPVPLSDIIETVRELVA